MIEVNAEAGNGRAAAHAKGDKPATILVIDDEDLVRGFLRRTLERAGYRVMTAADGHEGLSVLEQDAADLLITDIFMPCSDGLETIQEVRRTYPQMKTIAISGGGFRTSRDYLPVAAKFGADRTLSKPLMLTDLLASVRALLN